MDIPNDRSSHSVPTPRGGGLAIVFVVIAGFVLYLALWSHGPREPFIGYLAGAVLIAWVSWLDDRKPLATKWRFLVHCVAAALVLLTSGFWDTLIVSNTGRFSIGWFGLPLTFLWIVGLTNSYNFMDGIDGIAGGQAVVVGGGWALIGLLHHEEDIAILGLLILASSLGFLIHNWQPARIFMGDVGSTFLGFTSAALPVIAYQRDPKLALAGVLMVWPFVFDTLYTVFRRLRKRENIFAAHRSHLYQRLVSTGVTHRVVSSLYSFLAFAGLALAVLYLRIGNSLAAFPVVALLFISLLVFVEMREKEIGKN
jgi:UDP-N-acetylmuramyl pentapeptide phosphotransferase/UDP-N-acetylglucosamine-1-phosphate transferase